MESTRNRNTELGRPKLPAGRVTVSEHPDPECSVTTSGDGASKSPKSSRLGRRKSKWSHSENKILWKCYIKSITPLSTSYMKRMHQLWTEHKVKTGIVPLVTGALGSVSKQLKTYSDVTGIPNIIGSAQISTITSTARILRDVLSL